MNTEKNIQSDPSRKRKLAFRIITAILVLGMLAGGLTTLFRMEAQVTIFEHLGYPLFLMSIIGVGKVLAAIVLLLPGIPSLKIAAYVGTFIVSVCAFISHMVAGDSAGQILNPLILTAVVLAAYFLNPYLKVISTKNPSI